METECPMENIRRGDHHKCRHFSEKKCNSRSKNFPLMLIKTINNSQNNILIILARQFELSKVMSDVEKSKKSQECRHVGSKNLKIVSHNPKTKQLRLSKLFHCLKGHQINIFWCPIQLNQHFLYMGK
jgi:hypothetical protein